MIPDDAPILVVKPQWLDMLLSGEKTIEIRSSACRKPIGTHIYLSASRTQQVSGRAVFAGCDGPLSRAAWDELRGGHRVDGDPMYTRSYAWIFRDPVRFDPPIAYRARKGAIVWRKFVSP